MPALFDVVHDYGSRRQFNLGILLKRAMLRLKKRNGLILRRDCLFLRTQHKECNGYDTNDQQYGLFKHALCAHALDYF